MAKKKIPVQTPPAPPVQEARLHANGPFLWDHGFGPPLTLVVACLGVYALSVSNGFVFFDDDKAILFNTTLDNPSLAKFFSGQNLGMYAPITWMAYGLGQVLSGKEAWGYHTLALALHALNSVMVWLMLKKLTGWRWAAWLAALLFAVHPMQVEAVSWAAALSTVLFTTFYLGSILTYLRFSDSGVTAWMIASLGAFVLAVLSKSAAVTLPLVLLAIDFYKNEKLLGKNWLSKIPFFLISLLFGVYTFVTREREGHDIELMSAAFTFVDRFFMVSQTLLFYPVKLLVPLGFSISYPFVKMDGMWPWTYHAAPLALAGIAYAVWRFARNDKDVLLGLALYLLPLLVMLPYRTVGSFELRSDRYVYFSCIGLFFLGAIFLERTKLTTPLRLGIPFALAIVLGFLANNQTGVWKTGEALFNNCVEKTPESSLCQCNLAYNELLSYDFQGAIKHYSEALKYDPNTVEAYNGRAQAYLNNRQFDLALSDFTKALEGGIVTPRLHLGRGKCLVILNRASEALPDLNKSIELEPNLPEAYYFRAVVYEKGGNADAAFKDYSEAIKRKPDYLEALVNRGLIHFNAARYPEAVADYSAALKVNPRLEMVLTNRASAYLQNGDPAAALKDVEEALRINPNYPRGYQTRAAIKSHLGDQAGAQTDLQKLQQMQGQ